MRFVILLAAACAACAQTIITVQNAATFSGGIPSSGLAPGSIVVIQQMRGGPVGIGVDPSRVTVQVRPLPSGTPMTAQVLAAGIGTVLAMLPADVPLGEAEVTQTVDGQASMPARIQVVRAAAGLFSTSGTPFGVAAAHNVRPDGTVELNKLLAPAVAGDFLVLWGTGLGGTALRDVTVEIGGKAAAPAYAGPAPGLPGVDQINVAVPADVPDGCYVSVRVRTPESISNELMVAKGSARGACRHPLGFDENRLRELDANRNVRVVLANLKSEVMPPAGPPTDISTYTRNGAASVEFALRTPLDVALIAQPLLTDDAYFSCRLQSSITVPRFTFVDNFDAGARVDVSGPGGKALEARNEGVPILYVDFLDAPEPKANPADLPPPFFSEGTWFLSGPGGRDVAPFRTDLALPPPVRPAGREQVRAVDRGSDHVVSWLADGYTERDVMTVILNSRFFPQPLPAGIAANSIVCRAPAAAGRVTIPAALLRQIPATPSGISVPMPGTLELRLASHPYRRKIVDLPLTNGAAEKMVLDYLHSEVQAVTIR